MKHTQMAVLSGLCVLGALRCASGPESAYTDVDARVRAQLASADRLRAAGRHADAATTYGAVAAELRDSADPARAAVAHLALFWSGEEHFAAGQLDAAFDAYSVLFRQYPNSSRLDAAARRCLEIGRQLLASRPERAVRVFEKVTEVAPYSEVAGEAHMELGRRHYAESRFADAQFEFDQAARCFRAPEAAARAELVAVLAEIRLVGRPAKNLDRLRDAELRLRRLRTAALGADEARLVDQRLREVENLAAEYDFIAAESYLKQGVVTPALVYLREVIEKYPRTPYFEPARQLVLEMQADAGKAAP